MREYNFAINPRGTVSLASSFTTIEDAECYLLPYLHQDDGDDGSSWSDAGDAADTDLDVGVAAGAGSEASSEDHIHYESGDDDWSVVSEDV